jgi:hypothetical protein
MTAGHACHRAEVVAAAARTPDNAAQGRQTLEEMPDERPASGYAFGSEIIAGRQRAGGLESAGSMFAAALIPAGSAGPIG